MSERLLIIDDDEDLLTTIADTLGGFGYQTRAYSSSIEGLRALEADEYDLVLTDVRMPQINGVELCDHITGNHPHVPVIVMTAYGDAKTALSAMRAHAADFLTKPFSEHELGSAVRRALQRANGFEVQRLPMDLPAPAASMTRLVGSSPAMRSALERLLRAAPTDSTVLLTGESGTGKELFARALHEHSHRRNGPFVALNCAAVPAEVLESDLFGHVRGAFTGAIGDTVGLLRQAGGGTLFLDEIGAMPLELQPKLLRALQSRLIRPVGGDHEESFDARIVAATNSDVQRAVEEGAFREDLFYRLNVITVHLPPLREREEDIDELAHFFLQRHANRQGAAPIQLTEEARARLLSYSWPGNVRELENCIAAAVAMARSGRVTLDDLPSKIRKHESAPVGFSHPAQVSLEAVERRYIASVLRAVAGNRAAAARALGIDRATLYRKMKRFGLEWRR